MRRLILALALLVPALAAAQTPGSCTLGVAQADLATPDLSARLFNTGSLFYGNGTQAAYTVPRGRGTSPVYAAGLWAGGRVNGEVRTAGGTYGAPSIAFTFWPGPLDAGAALPNPSDCSAFDRIWLVTPADVAAFEAGGTPAVDLREWPVGLGAPAVDAQGQPVPAVSRFQRIDLPGGERPVLGGGPTAFWVMNDVGNVRDEAGAQPLGIEVQVTAFAPEVGALAFRQSTFYRYTVVNRNSVPITDFHIGLFADPDLGDASDDLVGADTTRGMAYIYNGDNEDGQAGPFPTYGTPPPAFGFDILTGFWSTSTFASATSGGNIDPDAFMEVYNRLRGLWNDGSAIRACGNGYQQTQGQIVRSTFPGDPVTGMPWSEVNPGCGFNTPNSSGDRRFMLSATPVTLAPGASTTVDLGLVFARGADYLDSITALRAASDFVQAAHDDGTLFSGQLGAGTVAAPALVAPAENAYFYEVPVTFSWAPVAGATAYTLETSVTPDFATIDAESVSGTSVTLSPTRFPANRTAPLFWRVRTTQGGLDGPPSAPRAVRVYRYVPGALTLASGARAYVETVAPGGGAACEPNDSDEGCAEVGGDLVLNSVNSTGAYRLVELGLGLDVSFAPNDFEVRFTERGSFAYAATGGSADVQRIFRVPFEVWDIGPTAPGSANNPSDDVQVIVRLTRTSIDADLCRYDFSQPSTGAGLATRYMTTYYPTGNDYAAYAAPAAAAVAAAPDGCAADPALLAAARSRVDVPRGRPLDGFRFEQAGAQSIADLAGATVRFYTNDRAVAAEDAPAASALRLGAAFPNPASGALTVPVSLPTAGRLRLVDVLGRAVLDVRLEAGEQRVRLDTRLIAAGVYAVVLEAGDGRAVRTVTVVR